MISHAQLKHKWHNTDKCEKEKTEVLICKKRENVWTINHSGATRKCRCSQICKHYVICICTKLHCQCTLQVFASGITLLNAVSAGTCFGYQTTAAVTYPVPNATTLVEPMNESQLSWFSECILSLDVTYSSHQNWMISRFMNQHKFWWRSSFSRYDNQKE